MSAPLVSVIVLNWNGRYLLADCLASLTKQSFGDFEIILVDNGSDDGSVEWASANYPKVRVISLKSNKGFCGGNNAGIREAQGDYVVLLNNDTEVESDWLESLYQSISLDSRIAACDSKILYFDRRDTIWSAGGVYTIAGAVFSRGNMQRDDMIQQPVDVFSAVACSAIYRKSVLHEIGLLDEDFFAGYEDVDWSFRAHLRGYRIVNAPMSRVYHKVSATHGYNSNSFVYRGQRNIVSVFIKNMPSVLLIRYWPLHLLYTLGSFVYFIKIGRGRAFLRAKKDILAQWASLWHKRRQTQQLFTVSAAEVDSQLNRDWFNTKLQKFLSR